MALPVNYQLVDGDVGFCTATGTVLDSVHEGDTASFEVDHVDEAMSEGWSVLVSGAVTRVVDPTERQRLEAVDVEPWAGGDRPVWLCVVAREVTGRRIRVV